MSDPDLLTALADGTWCGLVTRLKSAGVDVAATVAETVEGANLPIDPASARLRREAERAVRFATTTFAAPTPLPDGRAVVSVVVTAHDVGAWIGETLDGLHQQTAPALEVIVVDDHSTDDTSRIVDEWARVDERFRVVRPVLRGGANARNVGADLAIGAFVAFVDGDDVVAPDAYAHLLDGIASDRTDVVYGNFVRIDHDGTERRSTASIASFASDLRDVRLDDHADLLTNRACWNKLYRLETWRRADIVFVESPRANDIAAGTAICLAADRLSVVTADVYRYHRRPGRSSMTAGAGSVTSLVGYLDQERWCREAVVSTARPAVVAGHARVALARSAWVEVRGYLRDLGDKPVDPAVTVALQRLVDAFTDEMSALPAAIRLVFGLVLDGSDLATRSVALLPKPRADEIASRIEGWANLLEQLPDPRRPWQLDRGAVVDEFVAPLLGRPDGGAGRLVRSAFLP